MVCSPTAEPFPLLDVLGSLMAVPPFPRWLIILYDNFQLIKRKRGEQPFEIYLLAIAEGEK